MISTAANNRNSLPEESALSEAAASEKTGEGRSTAPSAGSEIYDWLTALVSALVFCVLTFAFFARIMGVIGPSMSPSFSDGDMVVLCNLFYEPKPGDVVILRKQQFDEKPIIKRVIAVEGQTVDIDFEQGVVYVDGEPQDESYTAEPTFNRLDFEGRITVPEGQIFVMGDNRNNSSDSRLNTIGCVDRRYILGKVLARVFPLSGIGAVKNPHAG